MSKITGVTLLLGLCCVFCQDMMDGEMGGGTGGGMGGGMRGGQGGMSGGMGRGMRGGQGGMGGGMRGGQGGMSGGMGRGMRGGQGGMGGGMRGGHGGMGGGMRGGQGGMGGEGGMSGGMGMHGHGHGRKHGGTRGHGGKGSNPNRHAAKGFHGGKGAPGGKNPFGTRRQMNMAVIGLTKLIDDMMNVSVEIKKKDKLPRILKKAHAHVKGIIAAKERTIGHELSFVNADAEAKKAMTKKVSEALKAETQKWNGKCKKFYVEIQSQIGDNPKGAAFKKAKADMFKIVDQYIEAMDKVIRAFEEKIHNMDKGYFLDDVKESEGTRGMVRAMMMDVRKMTANLEVEIEHELVEVQPHHAEGEVPTMAESLLHKMLENIKSKYCAEFSQNSQKEMQKMHKGGIDSKPQLSDLKNTLKELAQQEKETLKKALAEMKKVVDVNTVDEKVQKLHDHLIMKSQQLFRTVKKAHAGDLKQIMDNVVQKVHGKPGAKIVEVMLRKHSKTVLADIQNNMGSLIKIACDNALESGETHLKKQSDNALPDLKAGIEKEMDTAVETLTNYADDLVQQITNGEGMFGRLAAMRQRKGKGGKGRHGGGGPMKGGRKGAHGGQRGGRMGGGGQGGVMGHGKMGGMGAGMMDKMKRGGNGEQVPMY